MAVPTTSYRGLSSPDCIIIRCKCVKYRFMFLSLASCAPQLVPIFHVSLCLLIVLGICSMFSAEHFPVRKTQFSNCCWGFRVVVREWPTYGQTALHLNPPKQTRCTKGIEGASECYVTLGRHGMGCYVHIISIKESFVAIVGVKNEKEMKRTIFYG